MCGIAGLLSLDGRPAQPDQVRAMCAAIVHRGPDDEGFYADAEVALGMRRLSILDLDGGHQPMSNEDGSVWAVFNGEIYNYRELRAGLDARGHVLRSAGDTETLVHLYEEHGADFVSQLRGMFALAIWDRRRRTLLLARDRLGIKPLFYAQRGSTLYFASEVKALLQVPAIDRQLDWQAVGHLFAALSTPPDRSILAGVRKLEPARTLVAGPGRPPVVRRYWEIRFEPDRTSTEGELCERLRAHLDAAVREHLASDVPLGAFLSGGIDSSAVVATMARLGVAPIRTFSIGFSERTHDELAYARRVARVFGTEHHELVLEPDVLGVLDDLVWHLDEPFGDSSAIPTFMVSRLAARHVTVVLSGDGGDELFAGYERYQVEERERRVARIPRWIRVLAGRIATATPEWTRGRNFLRHHALDGWERYVDAVTLFRLHQRQRLFRPEFRDIVESGDPSRGLVADLNRRGGHWLSALQALDIERYLPLDILAKVDRMSMAHSIEARVPLLDHRLVEFAATIPPELQFRDGIGKQLFRRALAPLLPREILHRPKMGFAVPLDVWFRGRLGPYLHDLLLSRESRARGIFDTGYIEQLIGQHALGRELGLHLWTLISFELWCRRFLDGRAAPPVTSPRRQAVVHGPDAIPRHLAVSRRST
ncbi:MAG TPA: asparagine synthase (glutamine-hydrolyzing) [Vicinamibacterales bacterium]